MDRSMDELMWLLADEGDHSAVEAFIKRHPEHRAELIRRVNMVREMRGSKREARPGKSFTPSESVRELPSADRRVLMGVAATLVMFTISFGAWSFNRASSRQAQVASAPVTELATTAETSGPPSPSFDPNMNVVPPTPTPPPAPPLYETPVSIESDGMDLMMVFSEITRQTGLRIEMGPGMPNPTVSAAYLNVRAKAILEDLGSKVGFTVFEQGPDHVLIIPARESSLQEEPTVPSEPAEEGETSSNERGDLPVIITP